MSLHWRHGRIAALMLANDIGTRGQLSTRLSPNVSRVTVYRSFTSDWQGVASVNMLTAVAREFNVPFAELVIEPFMPIAKELI